MNKGRKILFLLFINLGLVLISLYLLDMLQIIDYRQIINQIPLLSEGTQLKSEEPFLAQKQRLEEEWATFDEENRNFMEKHARLEEDLRNLQLDKERLQKDWMNISNMADNFERSLSYLRKNEEKVEQIAIQIENMPPDASVKILSEQEDDMIIDIMNKMNQRAIDEGKQSLVPFLLSKMNPEQAARVQRKILSPDY